MFKRIDYCDNDKVIDKYCNEEEVIKDATRFYHEHFTMEEDYDEKFEIKTFEQAKELFEGNGYLIEKMFIDSGKCPVCGSEQITYDGSEIDGQYMYYKCCCDKCNATFNEFYELVYAGMENIIRGDK